MDPQISADAHKVGDTLRNEFVVQIEGKVRGRPDGMVNPNMPTGEIEVIVHKLEILNRCEPLPFQIQDNIETSEAIRLKHRYLDLRRPEVRKCIETRIAFIKNMRNALEDEGFLDIETPYLYKSTPEGAREFLVPSRIHPGNFYALP